jgi:hypothetical protein
MAQAGEIVIQARVPAPWGDKIDAEAEKLGAQLGTRFDRSDIIRIALSRMLGLVQEKGEQPPAAPAPGA